MSAQILHNSNIQDIYPLTPLQQGMYYYFLRGHRQTYYCQMSYRVRGAVDEQLVKQAFTGLFQFHPLLKTVCVSQSGKLMGVILNQVQVEMNCLDISDEAGVDDRLSALKEQDRTRAFDLEKELPMRLLLVKLAEEYYEFVWSHHHIIMDGWSLGILINDFYLLYHQLKQRQPLSLPARPSYMTYLQWLEKQDAAASREYWHRYLLHYHQPASLKQADHVLFCDGRFCSVIDVELTYQLMNLAVGERVTLNSVVQALWGMVLGRYTDRRDVVFGTVVSGRPPALADVEQTVGLFINTLPMRIRYSGTTSFRQLVQEVCTNILRSESYQYYPLIEIQSASALKDELFDHLLVFENFPVTEKLSDSLQAKASFQIEKVEAIERTNYDFNLLVSCRNNELFLEYKYNRNSYPDSFVARLNEKMKELARQVVERPNRPIEEINLPAGNYPQKDGTAHVGNPVSTLSLTQLFSGHAEARPHKLALADQNGHYTFDYLQQSAERLACFLISKHLPLTIVPVMADVNEEAIIALLGILQAGAAFFIIDPAWPSERIKAILKDLNPSVVVAAPFYVDRVPAGYEMVTADHKRYPALSGDSTIHPNDSRDPAYVRYVPVPGEDPVALVSSHERLVAELQDLSTQNQMQADQTWLVPVSASLPQAVHALLAWIPSATTIGLSQDHIANRHLKWQPSPVLNGQRQYLLSRARQVQDRGMEGEVSLSGPALPLGYLNRPELTHGRLVHTGTSHPFFLTGRRGRQGEEGQIVISDSADIAEVNSEPVSLSEIEKTAKKFPGIGQAVCIALHEAGTKTKLRLWYTSERFISSQELRGFLQQWLPPSTVPAESEQLEDIPLNSEGLPDRGRLLQLVSNSTTASIEPRDEVEQKIRGLWSVVLEKDENTIDVCTPFFQYGGHSLKAIRLNSMIQKQFKIKISLDQFFSNPTVEGLAKQIKAVEWTRQQKQSASAGATTIKI